jgi:predicted dehydrogenase
MASTVADCALLIEAAERAGTLLMPAQVVRFFPEFAHGSAIVRSGAIGRPAVARTRRGGRAPMGQDGWFRDLSRSGGVILDLAIHDLDWLRWTLGEVVEVYARSVVGQVMSGRAPQTPSFGDFALIALVFESGAISHTEASWMDPSGFRTMFEVSGSGGMIEFDSRLVPNLRTHTAEGSIAETALDGGDDPYFRQIQGFLAAVQGKASLPVSGYDGLMAVSLGRAAIESARTGLCARPEGRV